MLVVVKLWSSPAHISKTKPSLANSLKCLPCETLNEIGHKGRAVLAQFEYGRVLSFVNTHYYVNFFLKMQLILRFEVPINYK